MNKKVTLLLSCLALFVALQTSKAQSLIQQPWATIGTFPYPQTTPILFPTSWTTTGSWSTVAAAGTVLPTCSAGVPSAPNVVKFSNQIATFNPPSNNLISPQIDFSLYPGGTKTLTFWMYHNAGAAANDRIQVIANTIASNIGGTPTTLGTFNRTTGTGWIQHSVNIVGYTGVTYIIFRGISGASIINTGNNMYLDNIGLDYILPACAGTPTLTAPTPASLNICPTVPFQITLPFMAAINLNPGITLQWQSTPLSTPTLWANVVGQTTNILNVAGGVTVPTIYRCRATCSNGGAIAFSNPDTVTLKPFYTCYCQPPVVPVLGGSPSPLIDSVSIAGTSLNNFTPAPLPGFYQFYNPPLPNQSCNLHVGGVYTIGVGYNASAKGGMWIDYNHSASFADVANEFTQINTSGAPGIKQFFVPPPAQCSTGITAMRVRSTDLVTNNGAANACTNNPNGETEDYLINILPAPALDLSVTAIIQPQDFLTICGFGYIPVRVALYNAGTTALTNFPVKARMTGPINDSVTAQYLNTLAPFTKDTILLGYVSPSLLGSYTIKAFGAINGDTIFYNDTATKIISVLATPPSPVTVSDTVCSGMTATITADSVAGYVNMWYTSPISGSATVFTGNSRTFTNLTHDTTFYVAALTNYLPGLLQCGNAGILPDTGGIMFNITPAANTTITIDSFAGKFNASGPQQVLVYYKNGSLVGSETNQLAWTYMGADTVNAVANTMASIKIGVPIVLTAGNTYAIYLKYNALSANNTNVYNNLDMSVTNSTALTGLFTGSASPREFEGTIYYHKGAGCTSIRVPVTAAVGPAPVVNLGNDTTVCTSNPIILDAGNPGATYLWSTSDITEKISVASAPGNNPHTISVTVSKYCSVSKSINLTIIPNPTVAGVSFVQAGGQFTFLVTNPQFVDAYQWDFGDGFTAVIPNPIHTYANGTTRTVRLILLNSCGSDTMYLSVSPTGIENITNATSSISLYPNPAYNQVTLTAGDNVRFNNIAIMNNVGQVILQESSNDVKTHHMDIANLPSGYYIMHINSSEGEVNLPFAVVK
ncbi:MAG: GEVED domain-containing protein [Bacteroidota bacterium]